MKRTWMMYTRHGDRFFANASNMTVYADGPKQAMVKFGFNPDEYSVTTSRKGYGHFTGLVEIRLPESEFCDYPTLPEFVLRVE